MMMTFQDIKQAVDQLSHQERADLRAYLDEVANQPAQKLTPTERAQKLDAAFEKLRTGLTDEEIEEMTAAMNEEYIEPWDEDEWKD